MNTFFKINYFVVTVVFLYLSGFNSDAQNYGLGFLCEELKTDKRTELNLSPDGFLKFNNDFELSFDLMLYNNSKRTYGYVVRIIDEDYNNVDLISRYNNDARYDVNLVNSFNDSYVTHYAVDVAKWIPYKIKFLSSLNRLILYAGDTSYTVENLPLKKNGAYKITFGANDFKHFKTNDVPSMSIKDVKLLEKGKLKYYWPLNDDEGDVAKEEVDNQHALVKNPMWIKLKYFNWKRVLSKKIYGNPLVAFDDEKGEVFILNENKALIYSIKDGSTRMLKYINKCKFKLRGCQVVYNSVDNRIYVYDIEKQKVASLGLGSGRWKGEKGKRRNETDFLHHNKWFNPQDTSIYIFGGYGQHKFKNQIQRVNLTNRTWSSVYPDNKIYSPRYMSGLGVGNDSLYILGGYGSESGEQLLNPKSHYDLIAYSKQDHKLKYKFEIPNKITDMCVANSMYIDDKTRRYYALGYKKFTYDGFLQLIEGDLDQPKISMVGSRIPYKFMDINSYADLFYSKAKKRLFVYTSYFNKGEVATYINLYTIKFPPNKVFHIDEKVYNQAEKTWVWYLIGIVLGGLSIGLFLYYMNRKKRVEKIAVPSSIIDHEDSDNKLAHEPIHDTDELEEEGVEKYKLILFGGFQVFNHEDKDITSRFTPLLKELFLLVLLYTYKNNKGISSEKLNEFLWNDKSENSARNNRSVNVAKLRNILAEIGNCELSGKTGYWKIINDTECLKNDYWEFLEIAGSKIDLTRQKVLRLIELTQKGAFLFNVNYEWLDGFKASVSDKIIDTLVTFAQTCDINSNAEFIVMLSDCIFNFDSINEEALRFKCRALFLMGKHSLAENTYRKFAKEYQVLYDEEYKESFPNITSGE